jgi:hypothetical protein
MNVILFCGVSWLLLKCDMFDFVMDATSKFLIVAMFAI